MTVTEFFNKIGPNWIYTAVTVVSLLLLLWIIKTIINGVLKRSTFSRQRRKVVVKSLHLITVIVGVIVLIGIWGVERDKIIVFISSFLTILGVGFFAQWSILSNITSGFILFFSHPMKIGSEVRLVDKDIPIEGKVDDITMFYVHILQKDGTTLSIPTNLFLQKPISIPKDVVEN